LFVLSGDFVGISLLLETGFVPFFSLIFGVLNVFLGLFDVLGLSI
jgi:hypothetical protein